MNPLGLPPECNASIEDEFFINCELPPGHEGDHKATIVWQDDEASDRCCCGQPLHYRDPVTRAYVDGLIARQGPEVLVRVLGGEHGYMVPRHYIALHGLSAFAVSELAERYGWAEVPHGE